MCCGRVRSSRDQFFHLLIGGSNQSELIFADIVMHTKSILNSVVRGSAHIFVVPVDIDEMCLIDSSAAFCAGELTRMAFLIRTEVHFGQINDQPLSEVSLQFSLRPARELHNQPAS